MKKFELVQPYLEAVQWFPGVFVENRGLFELDGDVLTAGEDCWALESGDWIVIFLDTVSVMDDETFRKYAKV